MANNTGITSNQEWDVGKVLRDARPARVRFADALGNPKTMAFIAIAIAFVGFFATLLTIPALIIGIGLFLWWELSGCARMQLPLQVPQQAGMIDRSEKDPVTQRFAKGSGIMYLGNDRLPNGYFGECWVNNSQSRTHFCVAGTTGSGKTMKLLGMVVNALTWGSGCIYVDGKAENTLYFLMYSLARRFGRDDDLYVLNFMTGGQEVFVVEKGGSRRSNSFNPFSRGAADDFIQLVVSLLPPAGSDPMWQGLAVGMIDAVIRGLCLDRAEFGLQIDPGRIREAIELNSVIDMANRYQKLQPGSAKYESVFKPIKAYLTNLPAIDWATHVTGGEPVDPESKKQHDFRAMQFLRQLTMLADTYGKVFKQQIPEVDMLDIILNNRILVVMIPSLGKSDEESAAVGKLVVTALRMIMAFTLGDQVEGLYDDVVESKATKSNSPFIVILDELGYYFTKGLAVIFAQGRSLGFCMVAAMQDFPALMKGQNKEEAESVIANTKFKESLAMEDSQHTADFFIKTAGEAIVTEVSGFSGEMGAMATAYRDRMDASLGKRNRVTLQELKDLDTADSIMIWRGLSPIRMRTFAPFLAGKGGAKTVRKFAVRLNRLISMHPPAIELNDLGGFTEPLGGEQRDLQLFMEQFIAGIVSPEFVLEMPTAFDRAILKVATDFPYDKTDVSGRDGDLAIFAKLAYLVENDIPPDEENTASEDENGSEGGSSGSGGVTPGMAPVNEEAGAENQDFESDMIDAADYLDSLPVEAVVNEMEGSEPSTMDAVADGELDISEIIAKTVMQAAESQPIETLALKADVEEALTKADSILSAKPPGDPSDASAILMKGIAFHPARPIAEPVDQEGAQKQIDDIMKSILDI